LVHPWDLDGLTNCIRVALSDDRLVDTAADENREILNSKYDIHQGMENLKALYI